jgi:PleD family two-component response regulator
LYSGDSNNLEEQEQKQDIVRHHHHFIARKNYDKTIMKKVSFFMTIQQQNQLKQINNISAKNKRIMLVEDEADIAMAFKIVLESDSRLKVDSFTEPFAALNNFKSGLYDLIMIDIVLPNMNGFELYYTIRRLDDKVKVCFITASEMYYEEIRKEAYPELDTNCFIIKPISNEELIRRVKICLGYRSNTSQIFIK